MINLNEGFPFLFVYENRITSKQYTEALDLAKSSGINILRSKELHEIVLNKDQVIGAVFIESDNEEFSFDIVVAEEFRGKGLGNYLVDEVVSIYYNEGYEEIGLKLVADVVNPDMERMLSRKGFTVTNRYPGHIMMIKEKTVNQREATQDPDEISKKIQKDIDDTEAEKKKRRDAADKERAQRQAARDKEKADRDKEMDKKESFKSEIIIVSEDFRLPGTDIILEKGDKIQVISEEN